MYESPLLLIVVLSVLVWYTCVDDRFILKQIKSIEISAFEDFAPRYLDYVTKALEKKVRNKRGVGEEKWCMRWKGKECERDLSGRLQPEA